MRPSDIEIGFPEVATSVPETVREIDQVASLISEIQKSGYGTNMSVEGLLNRIKAASPKRRRPPTAERIAHAGVLAEHMRLYLLHGHIDNRKLGKKGLKKCAYL